MERGFHSREPGDCSGRGKPRGLVVTPPLIVGRTGANRLIADDGFAELVDQRRAIPQRQNVFPAAATRQMDGGIIARGVVVAVLHRAERNDHIVRHQIGKAFCEPRIVQPLVLSMMTWLVCDLDQRISLFKCDTSNLSNVRLVIDADRLSVRKSDNLHGDTAFLSEIEKSRQHLRPASGESLNKWCAMSSTRTTFSCLDRAHSRYAIACCSYPDATISAGETR